MALLTVPSGRALVINPKPSGALLSWRYFLEKRPYLSFEQFQSAGSYLMDESFETEPVAIDVDYFVFGIYRKDFDNPTGSYFRGLESYSGNYASGILDCQYTNFYSGGNLSTLLLEVRISP